MPAPWRTLLVAATVLPLAGLAGCVTEPGQEASCASYRFMSIHYRDVLDQEVLREAFVEAGYEWDDEENRTAILTPPGADVQYVLGVVAYEPEISSIGPESPRGTIMSWEATRDLPSARADVETVAQRSAAIVNLTFGPEERHIDRWIAGEKQNC